MKTILSALLTATVLATTSATIQTVNAQPVAKDAPVLGEGVVIAIYWKDDKGIRGFAVKDAEPNPSGAGSWQHIDVGDVTAQVYEHWVRVTHLKGGREYWIPSRSITRVVFRLHIPAEKAEKPERSNRR